MKICFYAGHKKWGGLANNGGSRTILKSAQVLRNLGHAVYVVATKDRFTYFKHDPPVPKIPKGTEACIAVSILDTVPMLKELPSGCSPWLWIRGWETWRVNEMVNKITLYKFRKAGGQILVNSEWLQKKLRKFGIEPDILYPGYDECFRPGILLNNPVTIGTLYHKAKIKGYDFWLKVRGELGNDYNYIEAGREPIGDDGQVQLYQNCNIWFSAVTLEGLHNCAMEAGLCGCLVVHNNHPRNGIHDYSGPEIAEIYETKNVGDAVKKIREASFSKTVGFREKIITKIGTREQNMRRLIEWLK